MTGAEGADLSAGASTPGATPATPAAPARSPGERLLEAVVTVLLAVLVAVAGTVVHRMEHDGLPLGVLLGIALALTAAVLVRAVAGTVALIVYGACGIGVVLLMTYWGPGEDVLVTSTPRAMLWILTMPLAAALGWAAPRSWFSADRVRIRPRRSAGSRGVATTDRAGGTGSTGQAATVDGGDREESAGTRP
ncbi:hypothetical protein [Georgenia sp. Z1491]|uniref:hypothetical protein n=1 Tax=Georgenia sp. Z1491 TaxID=3416707 RepID=UPI003CE6BA39